jgi:hypothetical protein
MPLEIISKVVAQKEHELEHSGNPRSENLIQYGIFLAFAFPDNRRPFLPQETQSNKIRPIGAIKLLSLRISINK